YNEIDDQFAVVQMMLSSDRVSVEAIYAAPFFNARARDPGHGMELSYMEIHRILDRIGVSGDGLAFQGVTEYVGFEKQPRPAPAVDHLIERARAGSPENPLYVIAIGAISNVASALLKAPEIIDRIVVVWLGGNVLDWPRSFKKNAEFNLMQDIGGAQVLFDSGVPVVLVPAMGVASHLISTVPEIEKYVEPHGEIGAFLAARYKEYSTDHFGWSKEIWDMAAVGWLLNPEWAPSIVMPTPILTDDIGWVRDKTRHLMRYVSYVDRDAILQDFFVKLANFAKQKD
ncbi:MAG: nucleoside hydrolase, partial [Alphaproteobacteria bacterium HGW-Alphaproteobacteria-10]